MRARSLLSAVLLCLILLVSIGAVAQSQRGPSTPEERARVVDVAKKLEADPLNKDAVTDREWLLRFLIEVPDIHINICSDPSSPLLKTKKNKNHSSDLFFIPMVSMAKFIIENPDKSNDELAVQTAGFEGMLKAYEAIVKAEPNSKWPYLDDLIVKRDSGKLQDYVREAMKGCLENREGTKVEIKN